MLQGESIIADAEAISEYWQHPLRARDLCLLSLDLCLGAVHYMSQDMVQTLDLDRCLDRNGRMASIVVKSASALGRVDLARSWILASLGAELLSWRSVPCLVKMVRYISLLQIKTLRLL